MFPGHWAPNALVLLHGLGVPGEVQERRVHRVPRIVESRARAAGGLQRRFPAAERRESRRARTRSSPTASPERAPAANAQRQPSSDRARAGTRRRALRDRRRRRTHLQDRVHGEVDLGVSLTMRSDRDRCPRWRSLRCARSSRMAKNPLQHLNEAGAVDLARLHRSHDAAQRRPRSGAFATTRSPG